MFRAEQSILGPRENEKIAGANFCTDRQTMAIFHYFLFDFQIVKTSLPCHYAILKQLLDTFAVSAFFDDFFQNFTARIFARARKEKGEAAESKRPGERANWKL